MATARLDVLHIRTFNDRTGTRVVVDFDADPGTDRFMVFSPDGAAICIGPERVNLGWDAIAQLIEILGVATKTLQTR